MLLRQAIKAEESTLRAVTQRSYDVMVMKAAVIGFGSHSH